MNSEKRAIFDNLIKHSQAMKPLLADPRVTHELLNEFAAENPAVHGMIGDQLMRLNAIYFGTFIADRWKNSPECGAVGH